jgi:hypothetical protein
MSDGARDCKSRLKLISLTEGCADSSQQAHCCMAAVPLALIRPHMCIYTCGITWSAPAKSCCPPPCRLGLAAFVIDSIVDEVSSRDADQVIHCPSYDSPLTSLWALGAPAACSHRCQTAVLRLRWQRCWGSWSNTCGARSSVHDTEPNGGEAQQQPGRTAAMGGISRQMMCSVSSWRVMLQSQCKCARMCPECVLHTIHCICTVLQTRVRCDFAFQTRRLQHP